MPPPGFHAVSYHGAFASRAKVRSKLRPVAKELPAPPSQLCDAIDPTNTEPAPERYLSWAELLLRTRGVDVLRCVRCGGRMDLVAFVTDPSLAREILERLGLAPPPPG